MQKWEYCIVESRFGSKKGVYLTLPNGDIETDYKKADRVGYPITCMLLNQMGMDGWEIISMTSGTYVASWTLKRPKE